MTVIRWSLDTLVGEIKTRNHSSGADFRLDPDLGVPSKEVMTQHEECEASGRRN